MKTCGEDQILKTFKADHFFVDFGLFFFLPVFLTFFFADFGFFLLFPVFLTFSLPILDYFSSSQFFIPLQCHPG